jgi:hypothetical protein
VDDRTRRAIYAGLTFAAIGFSLAFIYPMWARQSVAWYHPLDHAWTWEVRAPGIAMDFYGRCLFAAVSSVPFGVGAYAAARYLRAPKDRTLDLFTAWAIAAVALAMLHFAWSLYFRNPIPMELPAWYVPR